jgi:transporter family-2 protein
MNSLTLGYILLTVVIGALGAVHIPINGALSTRIQSTLVATFVFYGIAFTLIGLVCLVIWNPQPFRALRTVPPWYFIAGVVSVVVVAGGTFLIPRIGAANQFVLALSAQLLVRMVISHFGWLDSPITPITWIRLLGGALLIVGAVLVVRP